jgi:hypothetical protein
MGSSRDQERTRTRLDQTAGTTARAEAPDRSVSDYMVCGDKLAAAHPPRLFSPSSSSPVSVLARTAFQFPLRNLFRAPHRLLHPLVDNNVGALGSTKRTALGDVKLAEVLAGKYMSPLSLKDFEMRLSAGD